MKANKKAQAHIREQQNRYLYEDDFTDEQISLNMLTLNELLYIEGVFTRNISNTIMKFLIIGLVMIMASNAMPSETHLYERRSQRCPDGFITQYMNQVTHEIEGCSLHCARTSGENCKRICMAACGAAISNVDLGCVCPPIDMLI